MLSEMSQSEKDNYHMVSLICGIKETVQRIIGEGRGGKNGKSSERETNHERLWTLRNKLRTSEERGVGEWDRLVMGIKEGTCCDEHWVLYAANESLNTTSKTNDVLYVG